MISRKPDDWGHLITIATEDADGVPVITRFKIRKPT